MKTLGERLKFLRGSSSQAEFALLLGIPQVTLGNYERNRNEPKFDLLRNICFRFEINVEWLLFGTGPMRPGETMPTAQDSTPAPQVAPEAPVVAQESTLLARCTKLEARLDEVERERRELTMENRQMAAENRNLWKENGELREKCARLEERQYQVGIKQRNPETLGGAG